MDKSKEVLIIGGGISGLGMAVQLKRLLGHKDFTLYEKSDNIGGTCFALKGDWSTTYPGRPELYEYFASVAERFRILPHCRFNSTCLSMVWDESTALWTCTFRNELTGEMFTHTAPVVVSAVGTPDRPLVPQIAGANDFQGRTFHSARWDSTADFKGKNVVVLGNGASATQFVPELVKEVGPNGSVVQLVKNTIIYATGFQTQKLLQPMEVQGVGGKTIHEVWDASGGAEAYKGTVVTGFPNFFILYGPNAATGQHSVIFHSECHINYSCRLLRPVLVGGARSIMVKPEAQRRDLTWVHGKLQNLVFNSSCQSWWMDPSIKKNTFIYPDLMYKYWLRTIFPVWSDFAINGAPRQSGWKRNVAALLSLGIGAFAVSSAVDNGALVEAIHRWVKEAVALVQ
ncbi:hypothetical protein LQW54_004952 [Pestalotiopsis sp. IQ-011]